MKKITKQQFVQAATADLMEWWEHEFRTLFPKPPQFFFRFYPRSVSIRGLDQGARHLIECKGYRTIFLPEHVQWVDDAEATTEATHSFPFQLLQALQRGPVQSPE